MQPCPYTAGLWCMRPYTRLEFVSRGPTRFGSLLLDIA
jgi:hypothetical protein